MDIKRREMMADKTGPEEKEDIVSERPLTADLFNALFGVKTPSPASIPNEDSQ